MKQIIEKIKNLFSFNYKTFLDVNRGNVIKTSSSIPFVLMIFSSFIIVILFLLLERYFFSDFSNFYETTQIEQKKLSLKDELEKEVLEYKKEVAKINFSIKKRLQRRVYMGHKIATSLHNKYSNKNKDRLLDVTITALQDIEFITKDSYFYVYDFSGNLLLKNKTIISKNKNIDDVLSRKDDLGMHLAKKLENRDEASFDWIMNKGKPDEVKKLVYVKKFKPLNIFILTTIDYRDFYEKELALIQKNYKNLVVLELDSRGVNLKNYLAKVIKDINATKVVDEQKRFFEELNLKKASVISYTNINPVEKSEYGWFRDLVELIPFFTISEEKKSVLAAIVDKDSKKFYLADQPITKIFENSDETEVYMQKQAFHKAKYLLIFFIIAAFVVSHIVQKKVSAFLKKLIKMLDDAEKNAKYKQDMLNEVLRYYPYPLLKYNDGKRSFEVNEAYKHGADFKPYYIDSDKSTSTRIQVDDTPENRGETKEKK